MVIKGMNPASDRLVKILLQDTLGIDAVDQNMGLVYTIANDYDVPGVDFDDVVSAGRMALIRATKTFDEATGKQFGAYAAQVIRNDLNKLFNVQKEYTQREKVTLDEPVGGPGEDEGESPAGSQVVKDEDIQADVELALQRQETERALETVIAALPDPRMRFAILGLREGRTFRDMATELGCTQTMAQQYTIKGFKQIRSMLKNMGYTFNPGTGMLEDVEDRADELLPVAMSEEEGRAFLASIVKAFKTRAAKFSKTAS